MTLATEREIGRARALRQNATDAETRLWQHLRSRQLLSAKFRRQVPVAGFTVDFACQTARLAIEIDGGQHAHDPRDSKRTAAIEAAGYLVLRYWNHDVWANTEGVLEDIARHLRNATAG
jgi:very-short-patch-repair endonuclease